MDSAGFWASAVLALLEESAGAILGDPSRNPSVTTLCVNMCARVFSLEFGVRGRSKSVPTPGLYPLNPEP